MSHNLVPGSAVSHHFNPQTYLRQFVNPARKNELWEYDLKTGECRNSTPKKSGCEDHYHSFERADGILDNISVEESFQTLENKLPKLFEQIRNRQAISAGVWTTFFLFAALQRARSPKALYSFQKSLSEVYQRVFDISKHTPDFAEFVANQGMNPDDVRTAEFDIKADRGHTLLLMLASSAGGNLARLLARISWSFLIAPPDMNFFTSDDPVCCWAEPDKRYPFLPVGPSDRRVEITFPLSRRVCALGHWKEVRIEQYSQITKEKVDAINFRTVANGWRYIYGPTKDARIHGIVAEFSKETMNAQVKD